MRRFTPLLAPALALSFVSLLSAGTPQIVQYSESLDKAIDEAKLRNVPIICFYLDDKDPDCAKLRGGALSNAAFVSFINEWACAIVGHERGGHDPIEELDPRTKKKIARCPFYPGITCDLHERGFADSAGRFVWTSFPAIYICKPDGTLAVDQKQLRDWGGAILQKKLGDVQATVGQGVARSQLKSVQAELAKGDERLAKEKWLEAAKHYEKISKDKKLADQIRKLGEDKVTALDKKMTEVVEDAKKEKDRHEAIVKLRKYAADMKGRAAADLANKYADELEKAPAGPKPSPAPSPSPSGK